jgi:hypothetical protein
VKHYKIFKSKTLTVYRKLSIKRRLRMRRNLIVHGVEVEIPKEAIFDTAFQLANGNVRVTYTVPLIGSVPHA